MNTVADQMWFYHANEWLQFSIGIFTKLCLETLRTYSPLLLIWSGALLTSGTKGTDSAEKMLPVDIVNLKGT